MRIALYGNQSQSYIRSVTYYMELHSVTCHLTQVNVPRLNSSQPGGYSIYLYPEGWRAELTYSGPTGNRTPDRLIASPTS